MRTKPRAHTAIINSCVILVTSGFTLHHRRQYTNAIMQDGIDVRKYPNKLAPRYSIRIANNYQARPNKPIYK